MDMKKLFYCACRNGDLAGVQHLIPTMSLADINYVGRQGGDTFLHVASFYGHADIVALLLRKGASQRLLNKYGKTPFDIAPTPEIRRLFRVRSARFHTKTPVTEWIFVGNFARLCGSINRGWTRGFADLTTIISNLFTANEHELRGDKKIAKFLHELCETMDPSSLVRLYTSSRSNFCTKLNELCASISHAEYTVNDLATWYIQCADLICYHSWFHKYRWQGTCYRGMSITKEDLTLYKEGSCIMNKSFLSTSKCLKVASMFTGTPEKINVICIFNIIHQTDAFDIESMSEIPDEREVLIAPNIIFQVKKITLKSTVEIELEY